MFKINSFATLVYFKKDSDNLITADNHFDLSYIRNYLAEQGIHTTQYLEQNPKLVNDLLDDMITIGNRVFIFYLDEQNYDITQFFTQKLKQIDFHFTIIWTGLIPSDYMEYISKQNFHDMFISNNLAEEIFSELMDLSSNYPKKEATFLTNRSENGSINQTTQYTPSPYQTGNILAKRVNNYSIRLDLSNLNKSLELESTYIANQLIKDFRLFQSQGIQGTIKFLDHDILANVELFNTLLKSINSEGYPFTFSGQVSLNKLSIDILNTLKRSKFNQLEIHIHESDYEEALSKIYTIDKTIDSEKMNILYSINLPENISIVKRKELFILFDRLDDIEGIAEKVRLLPQGVSDANINGLNLRREYPSSIVQNTLNPYKAFSAIPERALINGYVSFLSGYYPYDFGGGNSKHIGVQHNFLNPATYNNLSKFLGINSAIINQSEQKDSFPGEELLYRSNGDFLRKKNDIFDYNMAEARKYGTFLPHYHQVYKTDDMYVEKLQIDDHDRSVQIKVLKAPYRKANDSSLLNDYNFLSIHTQEDLDRFLHDMEHFIQNGQFRHLYEISSLLMDGCRWGGPRQCTLTKLHRFHLDDNQNILPCGGCSKTVGNITSSYINVVGNAVKITEEEQEVRGCSNCPVKDSCSQCVMLPDFMNREQYCEIRRKHHYIDEYINASNTIKYLLQNVSLFKDINFQDVAVSTSMKSHIFSNDISVRNSFVKEHIYLVYIQQTPIIVESRRSKLLKINSVVAMVFEGLLKGAPDEAISEELVNRFQINQKEAEAIYQNTIGRLLELNYIHNKKISVVN
ncbi:PqqD family protein [Paucisalibacillus globulus]|uniref:PqqD family protein n=1 Tax=Paucisalibacillus globulus TaxID=351095 RepID=UPI0004289C57|nr:PqqD family protein [Paucisalibacillus globulus]